MAASSGRGFLAAWRSRRLRRALAVAVLSDLLGLAVVAFPPAQWALDALTAAALFALLGFRWALLPALAIEVVPGLELFPAWSLVVLAMAATWAEEPPGAIRPSPPPAA